MEEASRREFIASSRNNARAKVIVSFKKEIKDYLLFYLLPLPGLIAMLLFSYLPMAGLYIVFEQYTFKGGLFGSKFVGLKNFAFFFSDMGNALRATENTLVVNVFGIILGTVVSVALAVMLNEVRSMGFRRLTQSMIILPYFISWIVAGLISMAFLDESNGVVNKLIVQLGGTPVAWYEKPWLWWPILILSSIWKYAGYNSIIYFAALTGFDISYYEAAEIDGATRLQKITKITLPLLKPTIIIMSLLALGTILNADISQVIGLTNLNPLLLETTDNINTYVYRSAVQLGQFESASAVQLYQSLFGFLLVLLCNWLVKLYDPEYSLF